MYQQHMLLKVSKPILKYTLNKYHVHLLRLLTVNQYYNTWHYIANCSYFYDSYITKFDFMNYGFANLVVAWL